MTKESFQELVSYLRQDLESEWDRGKPVSPEKQVLIALRYYATGSFQVVTGDTIGVFQCTVSRIVARVSKSICRLYSTFIVFPTNKNSKKKMEGFYRLLRGDPAAKPFPGVIRAIDCTHVQVLASGMPNREVFRNRKSCITINVQAICDADLNFINVVVR